LISFTLRMSSPIPPRERLKEVWRQLSGIGGGRSLGFGPNRVRSLPDGVAHLLAEYLQSDEEASGDEDGASGGNGFHYRSESALEGAQGEHYEQPSLFKIGDLCPECGQAAVVSEEGCRKCYSCGFSEC
jgi:ribonucleoside-diphosphate reductase alpha chain